MEKINCNISVNIENTIITISGIKDNGIEINYSGDVDFTELVNSLIIVIDKQKEIEYSIEDIPDDNKKLKLVLETLGDILKKYNENINSTDEINESDNTSNFDDDLPF